MGYPADEAIGDPISPEKDLIASVWKSLFVPKIALSMPLSAVQSTQSLDATKAGMKPSEILRSLALRTARKVWLRAEYERYGEIAMAAKTLCLNSPDDGGQDFQ